MITKKQNKGLLWFLGILAVVCTSASMVVRQPADASLLRSDIIPTPTVPSIVQKVSHFETIPLVSITMSGTPAVVSGGWSSFDLAMSEGRLARFSQ
jgi:hypothetical protein